MPTVENGWEAAAQVGRDALHRSIPQQWCLTPDQLPEDGRLNVMRIPYECGNLTAEELKITEMDVPALLAGYQSGDYTVEKVTIAFLKRAVIGQQLVTLPVLRDRCFSSSLTIDS